MGDSETTISDHTLGMGLKLRVVRIEADIAAAVLAMVDPAWSGPVTIARQPAIAISDRRYQN